MDNINNDIQVNDTRRALLCKLEQLVGKSCYGTFIRNYGPNGVLLSVGRWFRYPVTFRVGGLASAGAENEEVLVVDDKEVKTKQPCSKLIPDSILLDGFYKFGANNLYIMKALNNILVYLEDNYKISFDE